MIKYLVDRIAPLKKDILSFENQDKAGVLILDKKEQSANNLIEKIYTEAGNLIKSHKNQKIEINDFIKDAMKEVFFGGNVGVVLVQKDRIVIRGEFNQETTNDLINGIFTSDSNLNDFVYDSTVDYMSKKLNIEFLGADKFFNIPALFKIYYTNLIELIKKDAEYQNNIRNTSIKLAELAIPTSKSSEKLKAVVNEILKNAISNSNSQFYHATADLLLKEIAKANSTVLKYAKDFFDSTLKRGKSLKRLNFALIRRNTIDREKHLVFVNEAKKKIKEAKAKEFEFVRIAEDAKKRMIILEKEIKEATKELEEATRMAKEVFEKREIIRKEPKGASSQEYKLLSDELKHYNSAKTKLDVDVKGLHQKYELAKQTIENATDDRADYVKLLPEMIGVQEKKLTEHNGLLKEFDVDYKEAKSIIIDAMIISKKLG